LYNIQGIKHAIAGADLYMMKPGDDSNYNIRHEHD